MIYHHNKVKNLGEKIRKGTISLGGHKGLKIYGRLDCWSGKKINKENRVFFHDSPIAEACGYRPCGHCMKEKYREYKLLLSSLREDSIVDNKSNHSGEVFAIATTLDRFSIVGMDSAFAHWELSLLNTSIARMRNIKSGETCDVTSCHGWWYYSKLGVTREAKNPKVALAQVLWNVV